MVKKLSAMLFVAILSNCCMLNAGALTASAATAQDTETWNVTSDNLLLGDVNADAAINAIDASWILTEGASISSGQSRNFTDDQAYCADVNNNGAIEASDASLILAYAAHTATGGTEDLSTFIKHLSENNTGSDTSTDTSTDTTPSDGITGNIVSLTAEEANMLAALVTLEAGSEGAECQRAVASILINRMLTSNMTLEEVIYQKNQFSTASKVASTTPFNCCVEAVNDVLTNGTTLPIYVTFFRASYYHSWGDQVPYCCMDHTYFSYSQALKNKYEA